MSSPLDPNRTMIGAPGFDPNKTQIGTPNLNKTQMMSGAPMNDPNRTTAWAPAPSTPLSVTITPSRPATMANGPAREQFLLEVTAPSDPSLPGVVDGGMRTALNVCLVIDRSGSMEGPPLDYAKQACAHVVDQMGPNDILSIIVFDEIVEILMPPQRVTDRQLVKNGIQQIQARYTTNLYDGITLAAQQLAMTPDPNRVARMIVLTDGEPTAGITAFSSLTQHAADMKQRGFSCTFLGFGADYNEELLASMAKRSGGNYYYIPQPQAIPDIFRTELQKLMTVTSVQQKLTLKLARWVNLRGCTGYSGPLGEREISLELADLERGATMQVLLDVEFQNHPLGHYRVAGGTFSYTQPGGGTQTVDIDCVMEFTADAARYSAPQDPRVSSAAQISAVGRAVEKTMMGLKTQAITTAAAMQDLQKTQALLLNEGRVQEAREVTLALQAIQSGDLGAANKTLMGTVTNLDQGKK